MLYACVARFDVTENVKDFANFFRKNKAYLTDLAVSKLFILVSNKGLLAQRLLPWSCTKQILKKNVSL